MQGYWTSAIFVGAVLSQVFDDNEHGPQSANLAPTIEKPTGYLQRRRRERMQKEKEVEGKLDDSDDSDEDDDREEDDDSKGWPSMMGHTAIVLRCSNPLFTLTPGFDILHDLFVIVLCNTSNLQ